MKIWVVLFAALGSASPLLAQTPAAPSPEINAINTAWTLIAAFLGLNGGSPALTVYLATAGLVLVVVLVIVLDPGSHLFKARLRGGGR